MCLGYYSQSESSTRGLKGAVYCAFDKFCSGVALLRGRIFAIILVFATMAGIIGSIGEFDASKEDVVVYLERFELFLPDII